MAIPSVLYGSEFWVSLMYSCIRTEFRYKELKYNIRNISLNYVLYIVGYNHKYSTFQDSLKPLHFWKKSKLMDALEEFESYRASKTQSSQFLNDKLAFKLNERYDTEIQMLEQYDERVGSSGRCDPSRL